MRPRLHQTIWRWHFYAGLLVSPFMLILAVTGAIYLFNDEINDALHPQQRFVAVGAEQQPVSRLVAAALADYPGGSATRVDMPVLGRSAQVFVTPSAGDPVRVYVDPGTAKVLGSYVYTHTIVGFADVAHGSLMLGKFGDGVVELVACWGLILVITGIYLWWPRRGSRASGVLIPRLKEKGRTLWRDLHAVTGFWTALLIAFLIVTGLPWANVWGGLLKRGTDAVGIGYPTSHRLHGTTPKATVKQALGQAPWTLEDAPIPGSDPHAEHHGAHASMMMEASVPISVDAATGIFSQNGVTGPYRLFLPADAKGVFTAYTYPDRPQGQRTIHLDQYSGRVLEDVGFADYGWAAKGVELGVQLHMGNYFGRANQIVMLIACLGVVMLSVTGPIMWWRLRPKGGLGAPRELSSPRLRTLALITLALAVVFPLVGASLVLVLGIDEGLRRFGGPRTLSQDNA